MKQQQAAQKLRGATGFEAYYSALYGERWQAIKAAFSAEPAYVAYYAGGKPNNAVSTPAASAGAQDAEIAASATASTAATATADRTCEPYFLDAGSVRAAVSLPLAGAEHILDMCAAPGGKTLVLASCMGGDATLLSNERSAERRIRLSRVCDASLPPATRARVTISGNDGATMCLKQSACFDRILLDAPCSSERHVLSDSRYLAEWSPARIKTLAMTQWALLSSAWRMLTSGSYLLYSTCALAREENDGVITRLLKKFADAETLPAAVASDASAFCAAALPEGEPTEHGTIILPDVAGGAGPLYFCLLRKLC